MGWGLLPGHSPTWCPPIWVPSHLVPSHLGALPPGPNPNSLRHGHRAFLVKPRLPSEGGRVPPFDSAGKITRSMGAGCQLTRCSSPAESRPESRRLLGVLLTV